MSVDIYQGLRKRDLNVFNSHLESKSFSETPYVFLTFMFLYSQLLYLNPFYFLYDECAEF